jgi:hypothetical protein
VKPYNDHVPDLCAICATMSNQDALQITSFEVVETNHNACAPVTYYVCQCRTCLTRWYAIEVYDEDGRRPSQWSWTIETPPAPR